MGSKNWPPTLGQILLGILLLPAGMLFSLYDKCRVKWYTLYPRHFNWLEMEGVKGIMHGLFAITADSIEYRFEKKGYAETYYAMGSVRFNEEMEKCIWARMHPSYVPQELFMQQLYDQIKERREEFATDWYQIGVDENGSLGLQLTHATIDTTPPRPYRERAKAIRVF